MPLKETERTSFLLTFQVKKLPNASLSPPEFRYSKKLEIVGVGSRAQVKGKNLVVSAGYSHPVEMTPPDGITYKVESNTNVTVSGIDKEIVGNEAAKIRSIRPPEPYKGKGIKYHDERILRKAGKSGKK